MGRFSILCPALSYLLGLIFKFSHAKLTAMNGWVLTRIQNQGFIPSWSSYSINLIKNVKTRVALTKMQISCHLLPIESGRYKKIPRVERLCPLCNGSEIGDEFHYLLKCTHSLLSHIRGIFLESLYSINSNFTNMSCKALFLYIMSNLSASYTENILNCCKSEL